MKTIKKSIVEKKIVDFKSKIRDIADFPQKGVIFRDIAPLLEDRSFFSSAVEELLKKIGKLRVDKVAGIDARGFILAGILANKLNAGLVMVRKKGKLPFETQTMEYDLEYGKGTLEIHKDSIKKNERVLLVDDVLATGGTMSATVELIEKMGGKISGVVFLIILDYLPGRKRLSKYNLISLVDYL